MFHRWILYWRGHLIHDITVMCCWGFNSSLQQNWFFFLLEEKKGGEWDGMGRAENGIWDPHCIHCNDTCNWCEDNCPAHMDSPHLSKVSYLTCNFFWEKKKLQALNVSCLYRNFCSNLKRPLQCSLRNFIFVFVLCFGCCQKDNHYCTGKSHKHCHIVPVNCEIYWVKWNWNTNSWGNNLNSY